MSRTLQSVVLPTDVLCTRKRFAFAVAQNLTVFSFLPSSPTLIFKSLLTFTCGEYDLWLKDYFRSPIRSCCAIPRLSYEDCGSARCSELTGPGENRTRDPPVQAGRFTTRLRALDRAWSKWFLILCVHQTTLWVVLICRRFRDDVTTINNEWYASKHEMILKQVHDDQNSRILKFSYCQEILLTCR